MNIVLLCAVVSFKFQDFITTAVLFSPEIIIIVIAYSVHLLLLRIMNFWLSDQCMSYQNSVKMYYLNFVISFRAIQENVRNGEINKL